MNATDKPGELDYCIKEFRRWMRRYHPGVPVYKRRGKCHIGVGRFLDERANERWGAWQACWNYLRS
jgi:hypothetical protein